MSNESTMGDGSGVEVAAIAAGALVMGAGAATFVGATVATALFSDGAVGGGIGDWLTALWRLLSGEAPSQAWRDAGADVPNGLRYWVPTAMSFVLLVVVAGGAVWIWKSTSQTTGRERFGQPTDAREATPNDVRPLRVKTVVPPTGRMLLGRMAGHPKVLLATEDRQRHPMKGKGANRQGNRGSVAMIGPTGSGKTANIIAAITTWDGPVVNVSVKRDLFDTTAHARSSVGTVAVFDPGGATGLPTARWSPIAKVTTSSGALRTGAALAQAIPRSGVTSGDYWVKHGEKLLSAFMGIAGLAQILDDGGTKHNVGMETVSSWVTMMAGAKDPVIKDLLNRGLHQDRSLETQLIARQAASSFIGLEKEDHKIRSSIYATAALAVDPWLEPAVAHSATLTPRKFYNDKDNQWETIPKLIDLEWLTSDNNTLYLTASQPEFERLSPVLGGLLADLKDTLHAWDIAGRKLDKPLLIVIDEAGQLELGWLPTEVSTIAALGAFFVTAWQSLSQVQHRYGTQADAVLSGHRTKCFFSGIDDMATVNYLKGLLGSEHVARQSKSRDLPSVFGESKHRRSVSESVTQEEFAPANSLRQMIPGEAVLIHGTLPPIHLDAIRWWNEPDLKALVPIDDEGDPLLPPGLVTCPLSDDVAKGAGSPIDANTLATIRKALADKPDKKKPAAKRPGGVDRDKAVPKAASPPGEVRQVAARCDRCGIQLQRTSGVMLELDGEPISLCSLDCDGKREAD